MLALVIRILYSFVVSNVLRGSRSQSGSGAVDVCAELVPNGAVDFVETGPFCWNMELLVGTIVDNPLGFWGASCWGHLLRSRKVNDRLTNFAGQ